MTDQTPGNKAAALEYKGQKTPIVSALGTDEMADARPVQRARCAHLPGTWSTS